MPSIAGHPVLTSVDDVWSSFLRRVRLLGRDAIAGHHGGNPNWDAGAFVFALIPVRYTKGELGHLGSNGTNLGTACDSIIKSLQASRSHASKPARVYSDTPGL